MIEASVDWTRPEPVALPTARVANAIAVPAPGETRSVPDRLLRLPEVKRRTGLSRATIYRRMGVGRLPGNVPLSGNVTALREADVAAWIRDPA